MELTINYDPAVCDDKTVRTFAHVCMASISKDLATDMRDGTVEAIPSIGMMFGQQFSMALRNQFYGREVGKITVSYPCSWWQELRRHLPTFTLTRWFPIRWTVRHFNVKEIIPGFEPLQGAVLVTDEVRR